MVSAGLIGCCSDKYEERLVELRSVAAQVEVRGFVAHLEVRLAYVNREEDPMEVTYVCPVQEGAAIYSFTAQLEGRTITAHCMEKEKAKKIYKDAVDSGKTALLASEDSRSADVIYLQLGNLPPGESAELTLKLVMELPVGTDGGLAFTLPTVFNPRYSPEAEASCDFFTPHDDVIVLKPYSIAVKADVFCDESTKVTSLTDDVSTTYVTEEKVMKVNQAGAYKADHDWSIQIYYLNPYSPIVIRETGDPSATGFMRSDMLMLNVFPEIPASSYSSKHEIIFIVDRSGSMTGENIKSARATLLIFLKSLPPGCYFNVISFGSAHFFLFRNGSVPYTPESLAQACQLQEEMEADMGGTEVLRPFQDLYSQPLIPGYTRQVLLITDGAVWNVSDVTDLVRRNAQRARVFAVGVGEGASSALVKGVARAGRGRAEMVVQKDKLTTKVMGLVASMLQETVRDIRIESRLEPQTRLDPIPKIPPVVFGGQHLIMYARVPSDTKVENLSLVAKVSSKDVVYSTPSEGVLPVHDSRFSLHRLAARAQLRQWDIEDREEMAEEMAALSVSSGIVSSKTAFVGIDMDGKTIKPRKQRQTGFVPEVAQALCLAGAAHAGVEEDDDDEDDDAGFGLFDAEPSPKRPPVSCFKVFSAAPRKEAARSLRRDQGDPFLTFIGQQKFDGSWDPRVIAEFCGTEEDLLMKASDDEDKTSWVNAVAIAFLEGKFKERSVELQFIILKAKDFIQKRGCDVEALLKKAEEFVLASF